MNINKLLRNSRRICKYGAPMGARNEYADNGTPLYLQRVYLYGGYSLDGIYWGNPNNMYCAFSTDLKTRIFIRANNRNQAITKLQLEYDGITFLRGE